MSIFTEVTVELDQIYGNIAKSFIDVENDIFLKLNILEEEFENNHRRKNNPRDRVKQTLATTLQSIDENEDDKIISPSNVNSESIKNGTFNIPAPQPKEQSLTQNGKILPNNRESRRNQQDLEKEKQNESGNESISEMKNKEVKTKRISKKRGKDEVDGIVSPEVEKRQKRCASVRAQNNINKMDADLALIKECEVLLVDCSRVNMNLVEKLRREEPTEDMRSSSRQRKGRRENEKENAPVPPVIVKQEKLSVPSGETVEPQLNIHVKEERISEAAMPPPPLPKPRRAAKDKVKDITKEGTDEEKQTGRRSRARTKKQADPSQPVTAPAPRSTRSVSRAVSAAPEEGPAPEQESAPVAQGRPKRTKKKQAAEITTQNKEDSQRTLENDTPEKPRPKRTRKAPQKFIEEQNSMKTDSVPNLSPKDKDPSVEETEKGKVPAAKENSKVADQQTETEKKGTSKMHEKSETSKIPVSTAKLIHNVYDENVVSSPILQAKTKTNFKGLIKESALDVDVRHEELELENTKLISNERLKLDKKRIMNKEVNVTVTLNKLNDMSSPILQAKTKTNFKGLIKESALDVDVRHEELELENTKLINNERLKLDKKRIMNKEVNVTVTLNKLNDMNSTVVLPKAQFNHDPVTPKTVARMDETVVIEKGVADPSQVNNAEQPRVMNDTVVLSQEGTPQSNAITEDNSLLTDDNSDVENTPPKSKSDEGNAPKSAVKEKVQQFEEMATRMTRTKTRALANTVDENKVTPPDKPVPIKAALSVETLSKMNNLIFNGKAPMMSSSASKAKTHNVVSNLKSFISNPASQASAAAARAKEAAEETLKREKEDARKKKEAMLQAKREEQKRKREEKVAAAAAAREAAQRERQLALEAAARERLEKQAHADQGKLERRKEAERKKQELARKLAETEERRRAEEEARKQKLAEEQKRELAKKKQLAEAEAMNKELALADKEMEKIKKEYREKKKMMQRQDNDRMNTPFRTPGGTPRAALPPMEPVHMADGFECLNSNSEEEDDYKRPSKKVVPAWSTRQMRTHQLRIQSQVKAAVVDRLFSVRRHTPDLREIFPTISRSTLKRTSSAVWRTPPNLPLLQPVPE